MKVVLGCDHAAFEGKEELKKYLTEKYEVIDEGTLSADRCDYPDYATKVVKTVLEQKIPGILLCGSGIGVSIVANRYKGIRAALIRTPEEARLSRQHNDANVLCVGARINSAEEIRAIVDAWFEAEFEGGRHSDRLGKFADLGEVV
ncbi:MAG: ribose 5-phosphate isomerase B [Bacteriovoracaceae bacterium]|nr:ribose 5-phosphate isomerase B [Bacteriovoracaceae bacterium]